MRVEAVAEAIRENPDAKAVLVNNPTYYGICSNLPAIVKLAHDAGMLCLADEAHGTHFYFSDRLPISAMDAGADMAAVSMHKSGGSLTQSSLLLIGPAMSEGHVRQIINLTQTTSGSYLLMASLDIARRNLAMRGRQEFERVAALAEYTRREVNSIGGYYAFGEELKNGDSIFDFDVTSCRFIRSTSVWPASRCMIYYAMNMIFRLNSAISAMCLRTCRSATDCAKSSGFAVRLQRSNASITAKKRVLWCRNTFADRDAFAARGVLF